MTTEIVSNFLRRSLFVAFIIAVLGAYANAATVRTTSDDSKVLLHTRSKMMPVIRVSEGELLDSKLIGNKLKLAELMGKPQLDDFENQNQRESLPTARPAAWSQKSENQASLGASPATSVNGHPRKEYLLTLSPEATQELDKRVREEAFRQEYNYQLSVHQAVIQHTDYKKIYAHVIEDQNSKNDDTAPLWLHDSIEHRCTKRMAAIEQRMKEGEVFSLQQYTPPILHTDFENHGLISSNHVQALYGNHLQHVIHQEFIDVLQEASDLYSMRSLHSFDKELVLSTVRFAEVGVAMNRYGRIEKAMAVSDFCHAAMAYTNLYLKAFHQGVMEGGGKRLKHIIQNPVEFCCDLVTGPFVLARLLGKATYWVAEQAYNDPRGGYKKAIEKGTLWLDAAKEYYNQYSGPQMVQDGVVIASSLAMDFFLAHKCINGLSWMHRIAQTHKSKMIPLLKRLQTTNQQAVAIAGNEQVLLITAQDATAILKAENAGSTMSTVADHVITGHSGKAIKAEPAEVAGVVAKDGVEATRTASTVINNIKKGSLIIEPGGKFSQSEIRSAEHMRKLGNEVILRIPRGTRAEGHTSDLLVNGINYDVYTPITNNPSRIISAIAAKKTQALGIILDLSQTSIQAKELGDISARLAGKGVTSIKEIIII